MGFDRWYQIQTTLKVVSKVKKHQWSNIMSNYTLNISFDNVGLQGISQAGQVVTILTKTLKPIAL